VNLIDALLSSASASDLSETVGQFIAHRLAEASVWASPRVSDGVASCRVVEQGAERCRVCGCIWHVDQTKHAFWLDVERGDASRRGAAWTLYFDIESGSVNARRARNAIDVIRDPSELEWRLTLTGPLQPHCA
jgi:hypothetical protein